MEETIVIQFVITTGLGSEGEYDFRCELEEIFDAVLKAKGLGYCDGGQQGAGSAEIFCMVNNINDAVETLKGVCDKHLKSRVIAWFKDRDRWVVLDPPGITSFSFLGWETPAEKN